MESQSDARLYRAYIKFGAKNKALWLGGETTGMGGTTSLPREKSFHIGVRDEKEIPGLLKKIINRQCPSCPIGEFGYDEVATVGDYDFDVGYNVLLQQFVGKGERARSGLGNYRLFWVLSEFIKDYELTHDDFYVVASNRKELNHAIRDYVRAFHIPSKNISNDFRAVPVSVVEGTRNRRYKVVLEVGDDPFEHEVIPEVRVIDY